MDTTQKNKLVLVVDDDKAILSSIVELLEEEGFRTWAAKDGQDALELLQKNTELPDLILLDLMMPRKDGFAFREEQEKQPRLAPIPVVLMSADGQIDAKKVRLGIQHHIRKPLDLEPFLELIRKVS